MDPNGADEGLKRRDSFDGVDDDDGVFARSRNDLFFSLTERR